nr:hypothetical protein [Mycoplasmopsis bovis]
MSKTQCIWKSGKQLEIYIKNLKTEFLIQDLENYLSAYDKDDFIDEFKLEKIKKKLEKLEAKDEKTKALVM